MMLISLVSVLNLLYFYISTFRSVCAVPSMAVFCSCIIIIIIIQFLFINVLNQQPGRQLPKEYDIQTQMTKENKQNKH
jgi:hypothetical protein